MKFLVRCICLTRLTWCLSAVVWAGESLSQHLTISHLDVGQGDATLIRVQHGKTVLIDAGSTKKGKNVVLPYLHGGGVTSLDIVVASHYHADHIGGLDEVIHGFPNDGIRVVLDRGNNSPLPTTKAFSEYVSAAHQTHHRSSAALGQLIDLGDNVTLRCLAVDGSVLNFGAVPNARSDENNLSIAWLLSFENVVNGRKYTFRYFTGGDCGGETSNYADLETPLAFVVGDIDVMKINHHGSRYSSHRTFLDSLRPEAAVISVGDNNSYGHPAQETLNRLDSTVSVRYIYQTERGNGGTSSKAKVLGTVQVAVFDSFYTIGSDTFDLMNEDVVMKISEPSGIDSNQSCVVLDYQNPMQKGGSLRLTLWRETDVSIKLYNMVGQIACTLANAHLQSGTYHIILDKGTLSSGVYFISLETSSERVLKKMVYLH